MSRWEDGTSHPALTRVKPAKRDSHCRGQYRTHLRAGDGADPGYLERMYVMTWIVRIGVVIPIWSRVALVVVVVGMMAMLVALMSFIVVNMRLAHMLGGNVPAGKRHCNRRKYRHEVSHSIENIG